MELLRLEHEPRTEGPGGRLERDGELGGVHPPCLGDLGRVQARLFVRVRDIDGADLVLDDATGIHRPVAEERECELDVADREPDLERGAPVHGLQNRFGRGGMAAERIRPDAGPGLLVECATRDEDVAWQEKAKCSAVSVPCTLAFGAVPISLPQSSRRTTYSVSLIVPPIC